VFAVFNRRFVVSWVSWRPGAQGVFCPIRSSYQRRFRQIMSRGAGSVSRVFFLRLLSLMASMGDAAHRGVLRLLVGPHRAEVTGTVRGVRRSCDVKENTPLSQSSALPCVATVHLSLISCHFTSRYRADPVVAHSIRMSSSNS